MRPMTYVAIDTRALARNLRLVRTRVAERVRLMAVVKANAYGHGLELAAHAFAEAGADWLGVSTLDEQVEALAEHRLTDASECGHGTTRAVTIYRDEGLPCAR